MDNYLVDKETLGEFVDSLIAKNHFSETPIGDFDTFREQKITELDDKIGIAVFGALNKEQLAEINSLMDRDDTSENDFQEFFENNGIDVVNIVKETMMEFEKTFLGGQNE